MLEDLTEDSADLCHAPPHEIIPEHGFHGAFREERYSARLERSTSSSPNVDSESFELSEDTTMPASELVKAPVTTGSSGFCLTCGGFFLRLDRHVLTHTDERPFSCKICFAGFRQKGHLVRHNASRHQKINCFTCPYCRKSLTRQDKLKHHMLRTCKALREF
ncbi:hypothetical protein ONE63_000890 [Megalurothrips usitatus]|uniref:C2H2-type domain-containing protein n=1 Tax=Megalurothrips usitatus TaxID=439358 RepID=A0AAV7Y5V2_9NEOP|nr:hypothetical protein ONE63_000890 [Megalurothrips usitatus]